MTGDKVRAKFRANATLAPPLSWVEELESTVDALETCAGFGGALLLLVDG